MMTIWWQDSTTSVEGDGLSTWSSGRQMSIREWDIPYEELRFTITITFTIAFIAGISSVLQARRQDWVWSILHSACRQLARGRRHQVSWHGGDHPIPSQSQSLPWDESVWIVLFQQNLDDENTLEAFRLDVATFRKTRHENLVKSPSPSISFQLSPLAGAVHGSLYETPPSGDCHFPVQGDIHNMLV